MMMMIDLIPGEIRRFASPTSRSPMPSLAIADEYARRNLSNRLLILSCRVIGLFMGWHVRRTGGCACSGRSGLSFLVSPVLTALCIGLFAVAVLDPLVAATSRRYDALSAGHARGGSVLSISEEGLWLRQGSDAGQTVIAARRANLDATELYQVYVPDLAGSGWHPCNASIWATT